MDNAKKMAINKLNLVLLSVFAISSLAVNVVFAQDVAAITTGASQQGADNAPAPNTAGLVEGPSGSTAAATDKTKCLPAVSGFNYWGAAAGDYLHNEREAGLGAFVEGGAAMPVLQFNLGAQLHAIAATNFQMADGYLFWRDPLQGLFGPHVMYTKSSDFHDSLYGLHAEYYTDNFNLIAEGGGMSMTNGHHSNNIYYEAIVNWYAKPDWRLYIGGIVVGDGAVQIGTEYLFGTKRLPGLALFADAGMGGHSVNYGFLGLRYYFGTACNNCKSLILRHREDMIPPTLDPISRLKHSGD